MAWRTRAAAAVAGTLLFLLGLIPLTTAIAAAESYGTSISASSTELTVGQSVTLSAENLSSGTAAVTICKNGWNGVPIAENGAVGVGGSIQHSVSSSTPGTITYASFAGRGETCTSSADSATSITWVSQAAAPTTTTTTAPSVSYSVSASAANGNPNVDTEDRITASNTSSQYAYISLCQYGSASPVAEGGHSPGTALTHDVTSSTAGDQTWYAYAGPSYGCSGASSRVVIDWHNTATVTVDPTSAGTTSAHVNSTTISWDGAKTGDAIRVVETNHNGTAESVAKSTSALSSFSGSTTFTATETASDGTQWVNDYRAELVNPSGGVINWEAFTFTWSGTSCTGDTVYLKKSTTDSSELLVTTNLPPICLPAGTDSLQVYWSPTEPSPRGTIPLLTQVGSCSLGTGPGQLLTKPPACDVTPASPHNTGWYEAYLIEDLNGSRIVVACSGHVELTVTPTNVYKLDLSASSATPVVGSTITLTAGDDSTNPEWLNICGITGSTDQAATYAQVGGGLTHPETSNTAGTVYYLAYASGSEKCGVGAEARVPVTWKAKPAPTSKPTPALNMVASNYNPTVGQSVTLTLTNTNTSSASEWLDYCGRSGGTLVAAGLHDVGGSLTTTVSSSSPGVVTYPGWAGTSEECGTVKDSVEVDWQQAPSTTTTTPSTTTTVPVTGTSGTPSTTTTVPVTGTSGTPSITTTVPVTGTPTTTTTVPPSGATGSPTTTVPVYAPTDVQHPIAWPASSPGTLA